MRATYHAKLTHPRANDDLDMGTLSTHHPPHSAHYLAAADLHIMCPGKNWKGCRLMLTDAKGTRRSVSMTDPIVLKIVLARSLASPFGTTKVVEA